MITLIGSVAGTVVASLVAFSYFGVIVAPWAEHPDTLVQHQQQLDHQGKQLEQITDIAEQNQWYQDFEVCQKLGDPPEVCKVEADRKADARRRDREREDR